MPQVIVLAQKEGRIKMDMEENAGYKKCELMPEHSIIDVQETEGDLGLDCSKSSLQKQPLRADIKEEVDELEKDGKDKEQGASWDPIKGLWRKCEPPHQ
ncbi:hypothetical protein GRJ2_001609800 [Grus japonensis]|uniref:Uncharacterized protein n=1 Tax=Grus japonensis TaxID=30415 RepID=A0ABC9X2H9_GRUJA